MRRFACCERRHAAAHLAISCRVVPNHSCVVSNLVDQAWLVDGERVVERLPVAARGRIT